MNLPISDATSRARLAAFLAHAPDAIFIKDSEGCYVEASEAFLTSTGRTIDQVIGRTDADIFPPDWAAEFRDEDEQVRSSGRAMLFEERLHMGRQRYIFLTHKFPLPNGEVAGIATNITERREAEEELQKVADRLRVAIEGTGIGTYEINLATGTGTWSEAAFEVLGETPPEDRIGTHELWQSRLHPDDRERIEQQHLDAAAAMVPWQGEYRIVRGDNGEVRWLFAYGRFSLRGEDVVSTGITFDITERKAAEIALKESEARLRTLTDNLPGGMVYQVATGQDGSERRFLFVSQSFEKLTGYPAEAALADPMVAYEAIVPEDRPGLAAAEERAILSNELFDCEVRFRRKDGELRWARIISAPRRQEDGTTVWDGIKIDITAQKRAEQQLRELNATLEQRVAERAAELAKAEDALRQAQKLESMGQLTGGVAHDFNNLLTPIIGGLDMLQRRGVGDERSQRTIEAALASAERAKTLVQRLLAFARRQPLQPRPVDVVELVHGMSTLLASTLGPRTRLQIEVASALPRAVADPNQLEMALLNLALNARDAMPEGGTFTIAALAVPEDQALLIRVSDTGCGMDAETAQRAIEPFFSTKGIGKGTGLGLSMVHGLSLQLGGSLNIATAPGQGTTIELRLPATEREDEHLEMTQAASIRAKGTALLVDDEELVRTSTAEMLSDLGFAVTESATAEEALARLSAGEVPSILVTDHLMPGMTGSQLIAAARSVQPELPVLLISGYADAEGVPTGLPRLSKPFRGADLEQALAAILKS